MASWQWQRRHCAVFPLHCFSSCVCCRSFSLPCTPCLVSTLTRSTLLSIAFCFASTAVRQPAPMTTAGMPCSTPNTTRPRCSCTQASSCSSERQRPLPAAQCQMLRCRPGGDGLALVARATRLQCAQEGVLVAACHICLHLARRPFSVLPSVVLSSAPDKVSERRLPAADWLPPAPRPQLPRLPLRAPGALAQGVARTLISRARHAAAGPAAACLRLHCLCEDTRRRQLPVPRCFYVLHCAEW